MNIKSDENQEGAVLEAWKDAIAASHKVLARHAILEVAADSAGWVDSGLDVSEGETITLLACGAAKISGDPKIAFGPHLFLWYRVGPHGSVAKFPAAAVTFKAREAGRLRLVANYPGAWLDETGGLDPAWPRAGASGSFSIAILVWRESADDGLACFAAWDASGFGTAARQRLLSPVHLPTGWRPLWRVGASEVYRGRFEATDAPSILCQCASDAAILKHEADFPLDETTRLSWRWRLTALPSEVAEDTAPTHDYLSIAVEFENGLDLTYMWSAALPVGKSFRCPLPWWDKRETHQVVRSGKAELGFWLAEDQPVLTDYRSAIGGSPPTRIVGVWLIAVAAAQRRRGECEYRAIRLTGSGTAVDIGP
jgi:hypothetical protein